MRSVFAIFLFAASAAAQTPNPGQAVYQKKCAGCHEQASERIPPREALQKLPAQRIVRALDTGAMMAIGFTLSREDRIAVANYLGTKDVVTGPPASAFCKDRSVSISDSAKYVWNGWSPGPFRI